MIENDFNLRQKVSKLLAFTFIILLSLCLGWYSIKASEEILANAPNSKGFNVGSRTKDKNSESDGEIEKILEENNIGNSRSVQE